MSIRHGIGHLASRALLASPLFVPAIWVESATGVRTPIRVMMHHSVSPMEAVLDIPSTPSFSQCTHVGQINRFDILIVGDVDYRIGDKISFNGQMEKRALDPIDEEKTHGF